MSERSNIIKYKINIKDGDVAQLGERLPRMQEVGGSNPPISTRERAITCNLIS